ncbi:hypothetical protein ABE473_06095 [Stenotrophomonas sp. TWI700]|uniref:hypothetical protein n=1 Tax=Stenotrophomonas sp. TWI700 TaxID=3136792 RepID=UPI003208352D
MFWLIPLPFPSDAWGETHPVGTVSDMRRADARRRESNRPPGITQCFQVSEYKVEPRACSRACNLFSNDCCRATLLDEPVEVGPEVPLVSKPIAFACRAERLAWAGTSPNLSVFGPVGELQCQGPSADTGEEVALCVRGKVSWCNIFNTPFIYKAGRNLSGGDQLP